MCELCKPCKTIPEAVRNTCECMYSNSMQGILALNESTLESCNLNNNSDSASMCKQKMSKASAVFKS